MNGVHIAMQAYYKIVCYNVVLKYFLEYSTTFFANYQPVSDMLTVLTHVAPYSVLLFQDKIGITPLVALCSLYVPKIIKFYRCTKLLREKNESWPIM